MINDLDHSITFADLDHFIRLQEHLSLNKSSLLDMSLLNQIPLLIGSLFGWRYQICSTDAIDFIESKNIPPRWKQPSILLILESKNSLLILDLASIRKND